MAGGPGGTGGGIQSESLAWAIIMSAFAGLSPNCWASCYWQFNLGVFSSVWWYFIRVCQIHSYSTRSQRLNHSLGKGMTQERLEELLPWKTGWWRLGHSKQIYRQVLELTTISSQSTKKVLWLVIPYLSSSLGALRVCSHNFIWVFTLFDRYPFSLLELSSARFSHSPWETWLAVNGGLSLPAWFSLLALACNSIPNGQLLS